MKKMYSMMKRNGTIDREKYRKYVEERKKKKNINISK